MFDEVSQNITKRITNELIQEKIESLAYHFVNFPNRQKNTEEAIKDTVIKSEKIIENPTNDNDAKTQTSKRVSLTNSKLARASLLIKKHVNQV